MAVEVIGSITHHARCTCGAILAFSEADVDRHSAWPTIVCPRCKRQVEVDREQRMWPTITAKPSWTLKVEDTPAARWRPRR